MAKIDYIIRLDAQWDVRPNPDWTEEKTTGVVIITNFAVGQEGKHYIGKIEGHHLHSHSVLTGRMITLWTSMSMKRWIELYPTSGYIKSTIQLYLQMMYVHRFILTFLFFSDWSTSIGILLSTIDKVSHIPQWRTYMQTNLPKISAKPINWLVLDMWNKCLHSLKMFHWCAKVVLQFMKSKKQSCFLSLNTLYIEDKKVSKKMSSNFEFDVWRWFFFLVLYVVLSVLHGHSRMYRCISYYICWSKYFTNLYFSAWVSVDDSIGLRVIKYIDSILLLFSIFVNLIDSLEFIT